MKKKNCCLSKYKVPVGTRGSECVKREPARANSIQYGNVLKYGKQLFKNLKILDFEIKLLPLSES